ncbi:RICIN domain-containing protein [Actinacidiphila yeochonensis]|uniref:RICIN domain-containing protein n=1 Tax=Actinacidiphila yeochonensis TaxID=89050 RepID=UPI00056B9008|nr:RICIN domain-containing protein [Actinacidiphila yeochonensis]
MRKHLALAAAVIGAIGAFAAAPGAAASTVASNTQSPDAMVTQCGSGEAARTAAPLSGLAGNRPEARSGCTVEDAHPSLSGSVSPAVTTGYKNFVNYLYGSCLDDSSSAGLRMYTCSDASYNNGYQAWYVVDDAGSYQFENVKTGLCLDGSSTAGIRGYTCSSASYNNGYQKWVIYWENSDGSWVDWKNVATGKCMDYSSTSGLRLYTCSSASYNNGYQEWNY